MINFRKRGKCIHGHCSGLSNSAWTDLNKDNSILKLHDMCANKNCNCQKQITFTPRQYQLEGGSIKSKLKKIFKCTEKAWNKFLKPALNIASAPTSGWLLLQRPKIQKLERLQVIF